MNVLRTIMIRYVGETPQMEYILRSHTAFWVTSIFHLETWKIDSVCMMLYWCIGGTSKFLTDSTFASKLKLQEHISCCFLLSSCSHSLCCFSNRSQNHILSYLHQIISWSGRAKPDAGSMQRALTKHSDPLTFRPDMSMSILISSTPPPFGEIWSSKWKYALESWEQIRFGFVIQVDLNQHGRNLKNLSNQIKVFLIF